MKIKEIRNDVLRICTTSMSVYGRCVIIFAIEFNIRKLRKHNINTNVVCIHDYFGFYSPSVGADSSTAFYHSALKCPKPNCWYSITGFYY